MEYNLSVSGYPIENPEVWAATRKLVEALILEWNSECPNTSHMQRAKGLARNLSTWENFRYVQIATRPPSHAPKSLALFSSLNARYGLPSSLLRRAATVQSAPLPWYARVLTGWSKLLPALLGTRRSFGILCQRCRAESDVGSVESAAFGEGGDLPQGEP